MRTETSTSRPRLPLAMKGITLAAAAVASIAAISASPDREAEEATVGTKARVTAVLGDDKSRGSYDGPDAITRLKGQVDELPVFDGINKSLDIPTALEEARNGNPKMARFLVKQFIKKQHHMLNPPEGTEMHDPENVDADILKEFGISREELILFQNADAMIFHMAIMNGGEKLKALAKSLEEKGEHLLTGEDQEAVISDMQPVAIMRILSSQNYGPGGEHEQLFLKLIGKSPQELVDLAHGIYDSFQGKKLSALDAKCLEQIKIQFGF